MTRGEHIITTYLELGMKKGFANVSLSDIASVENINKASIFSHFKDYADLKRSALEYCRKALAASDVKIDYKAPSKDYFIRTLCNSFNDMLGTFPVNAYVSMLDQTREFDSVCSQLSDSLDMMIKARLTVALDFCVQRGWSDINDTDVAAAILTPSVRNSSIESVFFRFFTN